MMGIRFAILAAVGSMAACRTPTPDMDGDLPARGHPQFTLMGGWSGDDLAFETKGSTVDGEVAADTYRLRLEGRGDKSYVGGGLEGFGHVSDEGLFGAGNGTEERVVDAFGYLYFLAGTGDAVTFPIRLGAVYQQIDLDEPSGSPTTDVTWSSYGFRIECEPELRLLYSEEFCWSVFGAAHWGMCEGSAKVDGVANRFDASSYHVGGEAGMRWDLGRLLLGVSWVERRISVDEADRGVGAPLAGIATEFSGVMISGGLRF